MTPRQKKIDATKRAAQLAGELVSAGRDDHQISRATGLDLKEISDIRKSVNMRKRS